MRYVILSHSLSYELIEKMKKGRQFVLHADTKFANGFANALRLAGNEVIYTSYTTVNRPFEGSDQIPTLITQLGLPEIFFDKRSQKVFAMIRLYQMMRTIIRPGDMVICICPPTYLFWLAPLIKRKKSTPILFTWDYLEPSKTNSLIRKLICLFCKKEMYGYTFILTLTSYMAEILQSHPHVLVMHGGLNFQPFSAFTPNNPDKDVVFICATWRKMDILLAVQAFLLLKEANFRLMVAGISSEEFYTLHSHLPQDNRIKFLGRLVYDELLTVMQKAHVCLNPKCLNEDISLTSFPSRIFELLATGRIIVSTRFSDCDAFSEHMLFAEDSPESFAEAMLQAVSALKTQSIDIYKRNRALAMTYDWTNQARRIIEWLNEVL